MKKGREFVLVCYNVINRGISGWKAVHFLTEWHMCIVIERRETSTTLKNKQCKVTRQ